MRWRGRRTSQNVEDRRSQGGSGGRRMRIPTGGRGGRIGGFGLIVIVVLALFFNVDMSAFLQGQLSPGPAPAPDQQGSQTAPANDDLGKFVSVVLADTEETWTKLFQGMGRQYEKPVLVLFSGFTQSGCGAAQSATGPFYCPLDRKIYIDLGFYREMRRMGASGDFAQAYVIAHEVGHHAQTLLGIAQKVHEARQRADRTQANQLSVRMELQADCFSGVWAKHADQSFDMLEEGDIEEALRAASAIGDDRLQRQSQGHVVPDSFTHGSSEQRVRWFRTGWQSGNLGDCETFALPMSQL